MAQGRKTGGRRKGSVNKATLARSAVIAEEIKVKHKKLGLDVTRELMEYHLGQGAKFQPVWETRQVKIDKPDGTSEIKTIEVLVSGNPERSRYHLREARECSKEITQYETPKLSSTTLRGDTDKDAPPITVKVKFV